MLANHPNVLSGGGVATNIIGGTGLFADGAVAAPSISFLADQDTGIYRIGENNIGVAAGGAKVLDVATGNLTVLGSGADCYIQTTPISGNIATFGCDGTGQYTYTGAGLGIRFRTNGGTTALTLSSAQAATFAGAIGASSGSAAAPSISFASDTDTGIYRIDANSIGVAAGGVLRARVDSSGITSLGLANQILTTDYDTGNTGSNMQMALLASSGNTSGKLEVYNTGGASGGVLNINTSGGGAVNFGYGLATFAGAIGAANGTAAAPSISFASDANTGFYSWGGDSIGVANGGSNYWLFHANGNLYGASGSGYINDVAGGWNIVAEGTNKNITLTPSGTGYVGLSVNPANTSNGTAGSYSGAGFAITYGAAYGTAFGSNASGQGWIQHQSFVNGSYYNLSLQAAGGRLLVGTTADSGALLQVGTNTITSAGGMVFGTDAFIYRYGTGSIAIDSTSATTDFELRAGSGTLYTMLTNSGDNTIISARRGTMTLQTDGTKTALTLDASQNATFAGTAITLASAAAKVGLRLPHGTAPTTPTDGDMWTTNAGLYVRINGATVGPLT